MMSMILARWKHDATTLLFQAFFELSVGSPKLPLNLFELSVLRVGVDDPQSQLLRTMPLIDGDVIRYGSDKHEERVHCSNNKSRATTADPLHQHVAMLNRSTIQQMSDQMRVLKNGVPATGARASQPPIGLSSCNRYLEEAQSPK